MNVHKTFGHQLFFFQNEMYQVSKVHKVLFLSLLVFSELFDSFIILCIRTQAFA